MSILEDANLADVPDHSILSEPYTYDIVAFKYYAVEAPFGTLELLLEKDGVRIALSFDGVHELQIDAGFPHSYMGLEILDVASLGWEHTTIRVRGFEEDAPGIRFWAKAVRRSGA